LLFCPQKYICLWRLTPTDQKFCLSEAITHCDSVFPDLKQQNHEKQIDDFL